MWTEIKAKYDPWHAGDLLENTAVVVVSPALRLTPSSRAIPFRVEFLDSVFWFLLDR